jgi:predicted ester cyclase
MDDLKIRRLAEGYTEAWCSQTPKSVASFYEEDGLLSINDDAPAVGRTAIAEVAGGFMADFPDLRVHLDDLVLADNETRYHWTLTGTNTGPGGTGRHVRISGYEVWDIGPNGLIANSKGHFDGEDYRRQINE